MEPTVVYSRNLYEDDVSLGHDTKNRPAEELVDYENHIGTLWGAPDPHIKTLEDRANIIETFIYSWIQSIIYLAAEEKLTGDMMSQGISAGHRTIVIGKRLSHQFGLEMQRRHCWSSYIGKQVKSKLDGSCTGTLMWVGYAQQSPQSDQLKVVVNWKTNPPSKSAEKQFDSGVYCGETLFNGTGTFTFEDPLSVCVLGSDEHPASPSIIRALRSVLIHDLWIQVPIKLVGDVAMLSAPVALEMLVKFLESGNPQLATGLGIVAFIFIIQLSQSMCMHKYYHISIRTGIVCRTALLGVLFEKCFKISSKSMAEMNTGRIVNMVSSDVEKASDFNERLMYLISAPLQLVACIVLLYRLVGWPAFASLVILIVSIPLQTWSVEKQHAVRQLLVRSADQRVKATNEFFSGIRIVKYMGWELKFIETIMAKRKEELKHLRTIQNWRILSNFVNIASPVVVVATVFILFYLSGHDLTPSIVFPAISLLSIMRMPFMNIPMSITSTIQFLIGMKRITKFLECDDAVSTVADIERYVNPGAAETKFKQLSTVFENATVSAFVPQKLPPQVRQAELSWLQTQFPSQFKPPPPPKPVDVFQVVKKDIIENICLQIPKGKLTVLLGPTGSGKSALMESLVGQFSITSGHAWSEKSIAFVPQQPWIMNADVRNNILFFSEYEEQKFRKVINCCELATDVATLINGLDTEIGEKGVNLSGGQRARVSLARAVYARKQLYLLDDPLSALDAHVGEQILVRCILGELRDVTRILATHHVHVAARADYVVMLDAKGKVEFAGDATAYQKHCGTLAHESNEEEHPAQSNTGEIAESKTEKVKLITAEEKAIGSVPWATYQQYFNAAGGNFAVMLLLLVFLFTEIMNVSASVWLSLWSVGQWHLPELTYLEVYLCLVACGLLSPIFRFYNSYRIMTKASLSLHASLLKSVSIAPMAFFDTTPLGRILTRFTRDMDQIDNALQMSIIFCLQLMFQVTGAFCIMVVSQPAVLLPLVPCGYVYYRLLVFYNSANREIRRVSSNMVSPVFALLTESLQGSQTITAYHKAPTMMREATRRIDKVYSSSYMQNAVNRWLGVRIELIGNMVVSSVACACVCGRVYGFGSNNVGLLSLGLTMSMQLTGMLNWIVRQVASVESEMNSIERVVHYVEKIDHEALPEVEAAINGEAVAPIPVIAIPASMDFHDVKLCYRPGLPLVLNKLTFSVTQGQKIGVVGRTGSGKSTLFLSFLRIVDTCGGQIFIGGKNISQYSLRELRSLFSIIPQDPLLFEGTVRSNLDPFLESDDTSLWSALEQVGMRNRIQTDPKGLEGPVADGGTNFSVGQRQLLCMARALQKKGSKFILMDEATANIDPELDKLIQRTIAEAFAAHTVVTIAHRLHTIIKYDRILVMDAGAAAEFDRPEKLAADTNSIFRKMIASQGAQQEEYLLSLLATH